MSAFQAPTVELSELWSFEDGTSCKGTILDAAIGVDGTSVLTGEVSGDWEYNVSTVTSPRSLAVKLDHDGTILWKWQDDTLRYLSRAAAMDQDGAVVLAGRWRLSGSVGYFAVWKLDPNGTLLWEYQDRNSAKYNVVYGLAIGDDGSIYCAGTAEWESLTADYTSASDYAAFKLDKDGTLLWKEQNGGFYENNELVGVALGNDGSVAFAGYATTFSSNSGYNYEYYVHVREQETGVTKWSLQSDADGNALAHDVALDEDGSVILAGNVDNYDSDGWDFYVAKLASNGTELWSFQDGGTRDDDDHSYFSSPSGVDDYLRGMAVLADGSILCVGSTTGDWNGPHVGEEDARDTAAFLLSSDGRNVTWRYQDGTVGEDAFNTVGAAPDRKTFLLAGYAQTEVENQGLVTVMLSTDSSDKVITTTPSRVVTPAPTPAPAAGAIATLTPTPTPTATALVPIFEMPQELALAFTGTSVSTAAMSLLVLGCCCWRGRTKTLQRTN